MTERDAAETAAANTPGAVPFTSIVTAPVVAGLKGSQEMANANGTKLTRVQMPFIVFIKNSSLEINVVRIHLPY
jgi:hypothetical protein